MPIMGPREPDAQHAQAAPLMRARRDVCSTLRRAIRAMRREHEERLHLNVLCLDQVSKTFWDARRTQKSILNPYLPTLCANGAVDPDNVEERKLIEYGVFVQGHDELRYLLPDDRLTERIARWWRGHGTSFLLADEDDLDALEHYVLHGDDEQTRAIAFGRLTGFWHWERCDAFSHVTYGCEPVTTYDNGRALRLCETVLATTEPYAPWNYPTPPIDALREGARQVTEHVSYGRVFWNDLTGVGEYARAVAARLGQAEAIEHWLLGCLWFCSMTDDDFRSDDAPYLDVIDAIEDRQDAQWLLTMRNIDGNRLSQALMRAIVDSGGADHEDLLDYLDAAQIRAWHGESMAMTVCDLLRVILCYPTNIICRALNRLALISVLDRASCAS